MYQSGTTPGQAGPRSPTYPGFETGNDAVSVPGSGEAAPASVSVPALNFNTNTVTISGWVNTLGSYAEYSLAALSCVTQGPLIRGLLWIAMAVWAWVTSGTMMNTYSWIPSTDATPPLPPLPTSDWAYVALVVQPDQAWLYTAPRIIRPVSPALLISTTPCQPGIRWPDPDRIGQQPTVLQFQWASLTKWRSGTARWVWESCTPSMARRWAACSR